MNPVVRLSQDADVPPSACKAKGEAPRIETEYALVAQAQYPQRDELTPFVGPLAVS